MYSEPLGLPLTPFDTEIVWDGSGPIFADARMVTFAFAKLLVTVLVGLIPNGDNGLFMMVDATIMPLLVRHLLPKMLRPPKMPPRMGHLLKITHNAHNESMMKEWFTASATQLAEWIRSGQTSSVEIVKAHIAYSKRVNRSINAVVAQRYEQAIDEAKASDTRQKQSDPQTLPRFHGVPCTIKESFAVQGMPQTAGLVARKGFVAEKDAITVERLRQAGAIPLGVTNTSELCMWLESNNRLYGRTNNPYDPGRIVGGSSGGEGAIVGSGASPFGLGADIGGSIRLPAFFNGVFGHKPTGTLVPATGQFPCPDGLALRYVSTGPLCRKSEDLWPLLQILAGPDGVDTETQPWLLKDPKQVSLRDLRVVHVPNNGRVRVHPDLVKAQQNVVDFLRSEGASVEIAHPKLLRYSFDIWASMLETAQDPHVFRHLMGYNTVWPLWRELFKWVVRASDHTLPAIVLAIFDNLGQWIPKHTARMIALGQELRSTLHTLIGEQGVMLYPPYSVPAPRHYEPMLRTFEWVYTAVLNVMELPVTQVPLGLNAQGLPLGVQVAGIPGHDHQTIAVACALEQEFGGWVPPWLATQTKHVAPTPVD